MHTCTNIFAHRALVTTILTMVLSTVMTSVPALSDPTITILHSFDVTDGYAPLGTLTKASSNTFYGTTFGGGGTNGRGTLFQISSSGSFESLHTFTGPDGTGCQEGVTLDSNGNVYGVCHFGGASATSQNIGYGDIFKYGSDGSFSVFYSFMNGDTGRNPMAPLKVNGGLLYGTASLGGTNGNGVVYKADSSGSAMPLNSFGGAAGGASGPFVISQGYLFGCLFGSTNGTGAIYKMSLSAPYHIKILHTLVQSEGSSPLGGLTLGSNGLLYGTTSQGGANNSGTIFSISPSGAFNLIYSFTGNDDGGDPEAPLFLARDGNLYGVTSTGGANGFGTIFQLTADDNVTKVEDSNRANDKIQGEPEAGLVQGSDGNFYGAFSGANSNQANDEGSIFRLNIAPKIQKLSPLSGSQGTQVTITGNNFTTVNSVKFNGTEANGFSVLSDTEIKAVVPSGATSGKVTVVDPLASAMSGRVFMVAP